MKKPAITIILLLFSGFSGYLPCLAQTGTEFWFVAPEVSADHGDAPVFIRLSTIGQPARVTISMPANPSFVPVVLEMPPNTTRSVEFTSQLNVLENRPANQVLQKGLLISASAPVTAYYEVASTVNPEIFPMKGSNALGTSFMVPAQNVFENRVGSSAADLVATEDNTTVTITPGNNAVGRPAGQTFSITLNRGETWSLRAAGIEATSKLIGTFISSDKPVAVTISDDSILNGFNYDLVGDQLVPIAITGMEYIAVKGFAEQESLFVLATEDNTEVEVPARGFTLRLNRGEQAQINLADAALYIRASKPVYAYQLTGHGGEMGDALLPQIDCTGSGQVGFVRSNDNTFSLMLLTRAGNENSFTLDGQPLVFTGSFLPVPGNSEWRFRIETFSTVGMNVGPHLIQNEEGFFHMGILHQLGASSVYGYFSNYNTYAGSKQKICPGGATVLDPGPFFDSYLWSDGSTGQTLEVTEPGTYTLRVDFENCFAVDTFNVFFAPTSVELGEDVNICDGDQVSFYAGEFDTYEWRRDSSDRVLAVTPGFSATREGKYNVTVANICGTYTDTVEVQVTPRPFLDLGASYTACDVNSQVLDAGPEYDTYLWDNGSTGQTRQITAPGTYSVTISKGPCVLQDQITVAFANTPQLLTLGEDRVICVNEEITLRPEGDNYNRLVWSDGSTGPELNVQGEGTYGVVASNDCGEVAAEVTFSAITSSELFFPNTFTPNGDAFNQRFVLSEWLAGSRLVVTNRWGDVVYQSENYQNDWEAESISPGLYYYRIESECLAEAYNGWMKIMR